VSFGAGTGKLSGDFDKLSGDFDKLGGDFDSLSRLTFSDDSVFGDDDKQPIIELQTAKMRMACSMWRSVIRDTGIKWTKRMNHKGRA
jgi:hypothetical protein